MPIGPGSPNPSGMPMFNTAYGLTAHAGGGSAAALMLPAWNNVVTVVATANDSVMLPPCYAGAQVIVTNNQSTTNALAVFAYVPTAGAPDGVIGPAVSATANSVTVGQFHTTMFLGILGEGGLTQGGVGASVGGIWKACVCA